MELTATEKQSSFVLKFITASLAGCAVLNALYFEILQGYFFGDETYLGSWTHLVSLRNWMYIAYASKVQPIFGFSTGLLMALWWTRAQKNNPLNDGLWKAYLNGVIRYCLTFSILYYAIAKIYGGQLVTAPYTADATLGDASGIDLTWYYFGKSPLLGLIIGWVQAIGALLLLYRRTTLLAAVILLPVILNIVLVNTFNDISELALTNSVYYAVALTYLIALDYKKLVQTFFTISEKLPEVKIGSSWTKHVLRLIVIIIPFLIIYNGMQIGYTQDRKLTGSWNVKSFTRNGELLSENAWMNDTTVFAKVYFGFGCVFSPNPYVYKQKQSLRGRYTFDENKNRLVFQYYHARVIDSLIATVSERSEKKMTLEGVLRKDTIRMELIKDREWSFE